MGTPLNVLPSTWTGQTSRQTAPDNADYHDTMPPADEASSPLQDGTESENRGLRLASVIIILSVSVTLSVTVTNGVIVTLSGRITDPQP